VNHWRATCWETSPRGSAGGCAEKDLHNRHLAAQPTQFWITDATPVPCGMSTETVKLLGLKRYLVCTGDGMPIMCLADPKIGEREVLAALRQQPSSHP
jgi:hypothetical protein